MSTLKTNTIKNTDDVEMYLAKAWVNFNGTGTVAIRAAGNVSSITDVAAGNYLVNFTTAMPDSNYAYSVASGRTAVPIGSGFSADMTTSYLRVSTVTDSGTNTDTDTISAVIFR